MRARGIIWPLAALSCLAVIAGVAALWAVKPSLGATVGIPAGATLIASIATWASSAPPGAGSSTSEQLDRACRALADRATEQLRGLRRQARTETALPALAQTLDVRWAELAPAGPGAAAAELSELAARMTGPEPLRLVLTGEPGCGKSTAARLIMGEILDHLSAADPVPVFLQLGLWDSDRFSLREWIERQIVQVAPELRYRMHYGADVVPSLLSHGRVLPIFDGLDRLPAALRRSVLLADDFQRARHLVLTCRTREFREATCTVALASVQVRTPAPVAAGDAEKFLLNTAERPEQWDSVVSEISKRPRGALADAFASPRIVYLASTVYRKDDPRPLTENPPGGIEAAILGHFASALLPDDDSWARSCPWYREHADAWLTNLVRASARPAAGEDGGAHGATGEIAWSSILPVVPRLYRRQVAWRALASALLAGVLVSLANRYHGHFTAYGWFTGLAYALAIAVACVFLAPPRSGSVSLAFEPPAYRWWVRHKWAASWRVITAGLVAAACFGVVICVRASILHGSHPYSTGAVDGAVAGMVVVLAAIIARVPSAPRDQRARPALPAARPAVDAGSGRLSTPASICLAAGLGIAFGLISGALAIVEHSDQPGATDLRRAAAYGLIMGLNFAAGAWLVSLLRDRTTTIRLPDPLTCYRSERLFSLLAIVILSATFASAFSLSSSLHWNLDSAIPEALVGAIAGSLASEWPLYIVAVTITAARGRLPLRLMKFLEICRAQGVLQPAGTCYRFREIAPWAPPGAAAGLQAEHGLQASAGAARARWGRAAAACARLSREYLSSRRIRASAVLILVCAVVLRAVLARAARNGPTFTELTLVPLAGVAAATGFGFGRPLGTPPGAAGARRLLYQTVGVLVLTAAGLAVLGAASVAARGAGVVVLTRDLAGLTGIALLSAVVFGGALAWVGPLAYLFVALYAADASWHSALIWSSPAGADPRAVACAGVIFAGGLLAVALARLPVPPRPAAAGPAPP